MSEVRLIDANALKEAIHSNENRRLPLSTLIDNAPTVDFEKLGESLNCQIRAHYGSCDDCLLSCPRNELIKLLGLARPQGEWISVSERLPEQGNQSYLVTVDYGNGLVCSCQRFFFNEDIGWNDDCVIAWQPLPEPYKEGGAE